MKENDKNQQLLTTLDKQFADWFNGDKFKIPTMTNKLYPYTKMFSPIQINKLTVKNRLVMAPMGNVSMCDETGKPSPKMIAYFEERAKGGVGLITTGLVPVSYGIDHSILELGDLVYFPRIDRSRTVLAGWRDLTAAVHSHGSTIFAQISAGLGRVGNPQCFATQLKMPVSSSFNPNFYIPEIPCKRLTDAQCTKIIKKMGQAAADFKATNMDGVYLHGHEGYLLEQMTNTAFNRRKVGKYADWQRFGIDTVKTIRERTGPDYPIMYRIDLSLMLNETYKDKMDTVKSLKKFKNERKVQQTLEYMTNLVKAGVDIFDVDLGCYDNWWLPHPPSSMPPACFIEISELTKKHFKYNNIKSNRGIDIPIVAVGKLGYPDLAEQVLRDEKCDMVMLGRPLLADPDWCNKAYANKVGSIKPCIGCQEACINEFVEAGHPQCAVNPRCAFEIEYPDYIPIADTKKRVAVIGAGPAGITATETLLKRGHFVELYEASNKVGGALIAGSKAKIKYETENYLNYLQSLVESFKYNPNFKLKLNKVVTSEMLKKLAYDTIIIACGSVQAKPPVEGINESNVVYAIDILNKADLIGDAKKIVVVGGGAVGLETAYWLKYELSCDVKVIDMLPYFMATACTANRAHLIHYLEEAGVELLNCTKLTKVNRNSVEVAQNKHKNVPNPYNTWSPVLPENIINPLAKQIGEQIENRTLSCDLVVLSAGAKPDNSIYFECVRDNVAPEIYNIGDSLKPARVFEAVRTAYRKARTI